MSTVGKSIYMLLMCGSVHAALELHLTTMDDLPLTQGAIGEPFFIQVRDAESYGSIHQPHVEGLDLLVQQGTTFAMHTINNSSTVVYKYKVRADKAATYTIGPATVNHAGTIHTSNSVELTIGDSMIIDKKYQKKPTVFAVLEADKECVVVGEKVVCTLTVYSSEQLQTRVQVLQEPSELKELGTIIHDPEALEQGTKQIQGKSYMYGQWKWEVYPNHTGVCTIPAFSVDYTVLTSGNSFFSFMDWWENKRTYSNGVQLQINELPYYDGHVDGIGLFSRFDGSFDTSVVKMGDACTLRLALTGNGNWGVIEPPTLVGIGDYIRAYYSNHAVVVHDDTTITKTYEYIIQGLKEGDVELDPQRFTFFDTKDGIYKQLTTSALYLTVLPGIAPVPAIPFQENKMDRVVPDIAPVRMMHSEEGGAQSLPVWLFVLLCFLPIILVVLGVVHTAYRRSVVHWIRWRKKKGAAHRALTRIREAQRNGNSVLIYSIVIDYFADIGGLEKISAAYINTFLMQKNVVQLDQWKDFFNRLHTVRFSYTEREDDEIFLHATKWILLIEECRTNTRFSFFGRFSPS